jgi:alkylhydroperoxidase family enzyme|tara:strand:- start:283 stop:531 length:249 start_codon:yes stop_codon:yes gene_type:complete
MAWIHTVSQDDAQGALAKQYAAAVGRAGEVAGIVKLHSNHLPTLRASMNLYFATTTTPDNPLPRETRELIATVVSRTNDCFY